MTYKLLKLDTNQATHVIYLLLIILFIIIVCIAISYVRTGNIGTMETFADDDLVITRANTSLQPAASSTPILVKPSQPNALLNNQRANVIYYGDSITKSYSISQVNTSSEYGAKDMTHILSIPLGTDSEPVIIKQILITNFGADTKTGANLRISAIDTKSNVVNFAGLNYQVTALSGQLNNDNSSTISQEASEIIYSRITQLANPAQGIFLDNVTTLFGTDLVGNKINIFSNTPIIIGDMSKIIITGYKSSHIWKPDFLNNTESSNVIPDNKLVLVKAITVSQPTSVNIPDGTRFKITYTNTYSNNVFTYPGFMNGEFIYTSYAPVIYLPKLLITKNNITILTNGYPNNGLVITNYKYISNVSQGDITQYRLENNLTDLRGSINPEYVCPDIQGLINKHLDAETIVDSMEYLNKINTEKVKLSSNKDNLLTLLEQEEDIKKLNAMITKLTELQTKRTNESDALAALQFTKQLNEAMKLREQLAKRIKQRDANTYSLDINVIDSDANGQNSNNPDARDNYKI